MKTFLLASTAATLFFSAGSLAQCDIHRTGVPDFDQKRTNVPNNGSMYCVPTSALNWMGYLANHGAPFALNHSSPNWANSNEIPIVTNRLNMMGGFMGTDANDGTSLSGGVNGIANYLDNYNIPGYYLILGYRADDQWSPSPKMMYNQMKAGWLVDFCFGYYDIDNGVWKRDGGHCMTLISVENACGVNPKLGFHNPNTSDSISMQSAFSDDFWTVEKYYANFDGEIRGEWQKVNSTGTTNRKFIDNVISIVPIFGISLPVARANGISFHQVSPITNEPHPTEQTFMTPGNAPVITAFPDGREPGAFVITQAGPPEAGPPEVPATLYHFDRAEETWAPLATFPHNPQGAIQDRFGNIFVNLGTTIQKFALGDGSVRLLQTITTPYPIDGMAVNDSNDELELLSSGRRHILSYPLSDLTSPGIDRGIPETVIFQGLPLIKYNPQTRRIYLGGADSQNIWGLDIGMAAPNWFVADTIPVPADAQGMQSFDFFDKGNLSILSRGGYHEYRRSLTSGQLVEVGDPFFGGHVMNGFFNLLHSRHNFNPRIDTLQKWHNVDREDVEADSRPACPADFNFDGSVDFFDYLDFVDVYSRGYDMNADFNFDGVVDFFDYLDFVDAFSAGC